MTGIVTNGSEGSKANLRFETTLTLAAKGWPVFPCLPYDKRPAVKEWENAATTDAEQIKAWLTENPDYNFGIAAGRAGLLIVDPDGAEGWQNWLIDYDWQCLPTFTVKTPRGRHLYFEGTGPTTVGKLAAKIDTRGKGGYVLAPGSVVRYPDGTEGVYTVEHDRERAALSECIDQVLASIKQERKEAPPGVEEDGAYNVAQAIEYLTGRAPVAVEGEGGDQTTYIVAAGVRDYDISEEKAIELMSQYWNDRCLPPWDSEGLAAKVAHAYSYAQNEPGCRAVPKDVTDGWIAEAQRLRAEHPNNGPANDQPGEEIPNDGGKADLREKRIEERRAKFRAFDPVEAMRMPPPRYWDKERLLIRSYLGSVNMLYAGFSNYKTTWAVGYPLHTAKEKGCRILYIVGEGADGFGPKTLQAAVKDWNDSHPDYPITDEWLRAHFRLVPQAPHLLDMDDLDALILEHKDWKPQLVFLDTLGSAVAGQKIGEMDVGTAIGERARYIAIRLRADTWLVHHTGKDASRGAMGSQYLVNDPTMVLGLEHDNNARRLTVTIEKDRWGEKDRKVIFGTRNVAGLKVHNGRGEVMREDGRHVAVYSLSTEEQARAKVSGKASSDEGKRQTVKIALGVAGARDFGTGLTDRQLAEQIVGPRSDFPAGDEGERQWETQVQRQRKALSNARNNSKWTTGLWSEEVPPGGRKLEYRWRMPLEQ